MPEASKVAFVFPGQGSQSVGMGRDLYETFPSARSVFEQADKATGVSLTKLIFEGPEEDLKQTINAQPAIVTVSLACLSAINEVTGGTGLPLPAFVAGHSLGEYAALAAAGVIDYPTAIYLVRQRGRLMHEAGQHVAGGMAAVLGLNEVILTGICRETDTIIANYNCPGQLVISGARDDVNKASELAKTGGAAKVITLQVSGAFHSPLMQPAVDSFSSIIADTTFNLPAMPIVGNVTAQPMSAAAEIRTELVTQLNHGVQWQRSIEYMIASGIDTFIEIGPGKVLAGMIKRINKNVNILNAGDVGSVRTVAGIKG